jgi:hypothetical protein
MGFTSFYGTQPNDPRRNDPRRNNRRQNGRDEMTHDEMTLRRNNPEPNKMVELDFILKEAGHNINVSAVTECWFKDNEIQPCRRRTCRWLDLLSSLLRDLNKVPELWQFMYETIWSLLKNTNGVTIKIT